MPTTEASCSYNPDSTWNPYAEPAPDLGPEPCPAPPRTMFGGEIGGGLTGNLRQALAMYTEPSPADEVRAEMKQKQDADADAERQARLQAQAEAHVQAATFDACVNHEEARAMVFCSDDHGARLPNGARAGSYEDCKDEWRDGVGDRSVTRGDENNVTIGGSVSADAFETLHVGGTASNSHTQSASEQKSLPGFEGYDQKCMEQATKPAAR